MARKKKQPQKKSVDDVAFELAKDFMKARIEKELRLTKSEIKQIEKRADLLGEQKKLIVDNVQSTIERENRLLDEVARRTAEAKIENREIRRRNKQRQKEFETFKELHKGLITLKPLIKVTHKIYVNTEKVGKTIALFDRVQTERGIGVMCKGFVNIGDEPENTKDLAELAVKLADMFDKPKSKPQTAKELWDAHEGRKANEERRLQAEAEVSDYLSDKEDRELAEARENLRKSKERAKQAKKSK